MNSLVSIIIPFYNAQNTLQATVVSALDQKHTNLEILLINDGSKDNSPSIAKDFSDSRIRYFEQENSGVSVARNLGLAHATGDFICFLDADDLITPDAIDSRLEIFVKNPKTDIVAGTQTVMDFNLEKILQIQIPGFRGNPRLELVHLNPKCFINCGTWLIRKKVIGKHKFPVGWTHAEDLGFFYLISQNTVLDYVETPVQIYRRHQSSAMSNLDGLLQGYINFVGLVKEHQEPLKDLFILKFKASKIMFLSFLSQRKVIKAIFSVVKITFK